MARFGKQTQRRQLRRLLNLKTPALTVHLESVFLSQDRHLHTVPRDGQSPEANLGPRTESLVAQSAQLKMISMNEEVMTLGDSKYDMKISLLATGPCITYSNAFLIDEATVQIEDKPMMTEARMEDLAMDAIEGVGHLQEPFAVI